MLINDLLIIKNRLSALLNMPLNYIMRCGGMGDFGFGEDVLFTNFRGETRLVSKYGLHLQCAFRLVDSKNILLANLDMYTNNSKTEWTEDFAWDICGANYYDEQTEKLMIEVSKKNIIVTKIEANLYGDLKIEFSNGWILDVFVNESSDEECWRFLKMDNDSPHLVITGKGI